MNLNHFHFTEFYLIKSQSNGNRDCRLQVSKERNSTVSHTTNCSTTLIICPLSVILQWKGEIEKHTTRGLKVYVYHGPNR
jgi:SNF2 family DNA or RNA helicase